MSDYPSSGPQKRSILKVLGASVLGLAAITTAVAAASTEVREWLGWGKDDKAVKKDEAPLDGSGNSQIFNESEEAKPVAPAPDPVGQMQITVSELRLNRGNQDVTLPSAELRMKVKNPTNRPLAVIWLKPDQNSRVDLAQAMTLARTEDASGVPWCVNTPESCWEQDRQRYAVIDPGSEMVATLTIYDGAQPGDQARLASVKKASLTGKLHVVDPASGQSRLQNISIDGIDVVNQIPPSMQ